MFDKIDEPFASLLDTPQSNQSWFGTHSGQKLYQIFFCQSHNTTMLNCLTHAMLFSMSVNYYSERQLVMSVKGVCGVRKGWEALISLPCWDALVITPCFLFPGFIFHVTRLRSDNSITLHAIPQQIINPKLQLSHHKSERIYFIRWVILSPHTPTELVFNQNIILRWIFQIT